jgi:hypothetical protein
VVLNAFRLRSAVLGYKGISRQILVWMIVNHMKLFRVIYPSKAAAPLRMAKAKTKTAVAEGRPPSPNTWEDEILQLYVCKVSLDKRPIER